MYFFMVKSYYILSPHLYRREALEKWKQKFGSDATYNNLIKVFEQAGYKNYAEIVKDLVMKNVQTDTAIDQTPPPLSEQLLPQLPVFPSESECKQFSESPLYAAAPRVKLLEEDYPLGTKEAVIQYSIIFMCMKIIMQIGQNVPLEKFIF